MCRTARWVRTVAALAAPVALVVASSACSGDDTGSPTASDVGSRRSTTLPAGEIGAAASDVHLVAQSTAQVEVWDAPDSEATSHVLSAATEASGTLTFLVLETLDDGWLHVQLPEPPPGSTAYVREDDVSLNRHRYEIVVSRSQHTLKVLAGGVEAITEPVAIGPDAPPAGTNTFIKELLIPPDGTPYGGHVYGLAGWSSTEQQFGAGSGVVAIHAAAPVALGTDTLTGAIGTDPQVLTQLVDNVGLPLGTPVEVVD